MKFVALFILLCAHVPIAWPCVTAMRRRKLPRSIDVMGAAFILYYDVEVVWEACGGTYVNDYFHPFFSTSEWPLIGAIFFLAIAPAVMKLGYAMMVDLLAARQVSPCRITLRHPKCFYFLAFAICLAISVYVIFNLLSTSAIWLLRYDLAKRLGPLVVIFYIPMSILAFYVRMAESHPRKGKLAVWSLFLLACLAGIGSGERTFVLIPAVILLLFWGRPSFRILLGGGIAVLVFAAILLPLFKKVSLEESASWVFLSDIARAPAIPASLEESLPLGTSILPYPGAGYVYEALLFIPRSLAPFKGQSTEIYYTAHLAHSNPDDTTWILGNGPIEDTAISFGWVSIPFVLFAWGAAYAWVDHLSPRFSILVTVGTLSPIWLVGYGTAFLLHFLPITVFGLLCQFAFGHRQPLSIIVLYER